ncbi:unnamed protein product [Ascophyllum nodosum]
MLQQVGAMKKRVLYTVTVSKCLGLWPCQYRVAWKREVHHRVCTRRFKCSIKKWVLSARWTSGCRGQPADNTHVLHALLLSLVLDNAPVITVGCMQCGRFIGECGSTG